MLRVILSCSLPQIPVKVTSSLTVDPDTPVYAEFSSSEGPVETRNTFLAIHNCSKQTCILQCLAQLCFDNEKKF